MGLIFLIVLVFLCIAALPVYAFYRPWGAGRNGLLSLALVGLAVLLLLGLLSFGYTRTVYYTRPVEVVNPPTVIEERPITVINPEPNSGKPVRIVPGTPQVPNQ